MKSYYDILGVPQDTPLSEIKRIHRKLIKAWHPDRFTDLDDKQFAEEKLKEINEVYEVLKDEDKRRRYDEKQREKFEEEHGPTVQKPKLVVSTKLIDFGEIRHGETANQVFWIENQGGPGHDLNIQFVPLNFEDFFRYNIIPSSNEAGKEFPIKFKVTLDTQRLEPDQSYEWKIIVTLDEEKVEVKVAIKNLILKTLDKNATNISSAATSLIVSTSSKNNNILRWRGAGFLLGVGIFGSLDLIGLYLFKFTIFLKNFSLTFCFLIVGLFAFNLVCSIIILCETNMLKFPEKANTYGWQILAFLLMFFSIISIIGLIFLIVTPWRIS